MLSVRTLLIGLVALAIAAGLGVVAFRTEPQEVDLHVVARGPMEVTVTADGTTRVREIYDVAAPVSGIARRAPVRVGDYVTAGETIVAVVEPAAAPILDPRSRAQAEASLAEARAAEQAALADVHSAEEQQRFAKTQHDRTVQLVDRGIASLAALESADLQLNAANAALDAAKSRQEMASGAVDRAEAALDDPEGGSETCCREIAAPVTGVVLRLDNLSQRPVQAGTPLLAIGDPTDLEIVADLLSSDAVQLPPGALARVERWGGEGSLRARLRRVDPVARTDVSALGIEEQRVDVVFDLLSAPEERPGLGQNYGVFLRIVLWQADDALRLPLSAAFRTDSGWATFVAKDGTAHLTEIELGRIGSDTAAVLSGLDAGATVVLHPPNALSDGAAITGRAGTPLR